MRLFSRSSAVLVWIGITGALAAQQKVALSGIDRPGTPAANAIKVLETGLAARQMLARWVDSAKNVKPDETFLLFSLAGSERAESFAIKKTMEGNRRVIAVTGADQTGLAYGSYELLGQVESAAPGKDLFQAVSDTRRAPETKIRSIAMSVHNRDLEREWFFSEEFWNTYFELLAKSRFNQFTLIFGHQTSYFAPVFPFMVDVPGYERVRTPDYSSEDRAKNLAALRMISTLAGQWGVEFILGMWQFNSNITAAIWWKASRMRTSSIIHQRPWRFCSKSVRKSRACSFG
jgi:hypothetical protein